MNSALSFAPICDFNSTVSAAMSIYVKLAHQ